MLSLKSETKKQWLGQVEHHLNELLIDHAHCEKKAASTAMSLMFAYVECTELVRPLTEIVNEELEHFRMVLDLLEERGVKFRRLKPSSYGGRLSELVRKEEPGKAIDRLLIAGLIEARSCDRFALLRDHVPDQWLSQFYGGLFESEARHHSTYVRLATRFASEKLVHARLEELAEQEAAVIALGDDMPRMHS